MFAVVFLDQRNSRSSPDLVGDLLQRLNRDDSRLLLLPAERTVGDELQALTQDALSLADMVLEALEAGAWWVGIGIGEVAQPLPTSVRESRGEAVQLARLAMEAAKRNRPAGVGVLARSGEPSDLEAALWLMRGVFARRPAGARKVVQLRRQGLTIQQIALRLGVTHQAVSKHLRTANWAEEQSGRRLVLHLAQAVLP